MATMPGRHLPYFGGINTWTTCATKPGIPGAANAARAAVRVRDGGPALTFTTYLTMRYSKLSVIITLLSVPTMFLMITILIFPAIGFLIGIKAYKQYLHERVSPTDRTYLFAAFPMIFAVVVCIVELWFVNMTYRA
nr:hypothetical protein [uncultured Albidiferax sp.]